MTFSMTCSCGYVMTVKGGTREKAIRNMKSLLNETKVYEHMAQKHIGDAVPTTEQGARDHRSKSESVRESQDIRFVIIFTPSQ